jgi:hypothetical protein
MAEASPYIIVRVTEPTKQSDTFGAYIKYVFVYVFYVDQLFVLTAPAFIPVLVAIK